MDYIQLRHRINGVDYSHGELPQDCFPPVVDYRATFTLLTLDGIDCPGDPIIGTITIYNSNNEIVATGTDQNTDLFSFNLDAQLTTGIYTVVAEVQICGKEKEPVFEQISICPALSVTALSCNIIEVENATSYEMSISITDTAGTEIYSGIVPATGSIEVDLYEITEAVDGVYFLHTTYTPTDSDPVSETYVITHFCTIKACIKSLIEQILCGNADDPCCNSCNEEEKAKLASIRFELNKIIFLFGYYLATGFYTKIKYLGVYNLTPEEIKEWQDLDDIIVKIRELTKRCRPVDCKDNISINPSPCGCS